MMKRVYKSSFAKEMAEFIKLRRHTGIVVKNAECALGKFDKYLSKNHPKAKIITRAMFSGFMETISHIKPITKHKQATEIRQFCFYLFQHQPKTYIPEPRLFPRPKRYIQPYVYTKKDMLYLMSLAENLGPYNSLRPHSLKTLFGLLWSTGIRVGEALGLNFEDYDHVNHILTIQKTKFFKSRYVPMSETTSRALQAYIDLRVAKNIKTGKKDPIFVNHKWERLSYDTFRSAHRLLIRRAGIKNSQGHFARIVDFRHSFATLCLERIQRQKKDPNSYLPILATYMGHAHISLTQTYLHPSEKILNHSGDRFHDYFISQIDGSEERGL